jgi:threonyl-tRNA synthetase
LEIELKKLDLRVETDYSDIHMREKIKRFELQKIPYILVVGDKDIARHGFMNMDSLSEYIKPELEQGKPKYIFEE